MESMDGGAKGFGGLLALIFKSFSQNVMSVQDTHEASMLGSISQEPCM